MLHTIHPTSVTAKSFCGLQCACTAMCRTARARRGTTAATTSVCVRTPCRASTGVTTGKPNVLRRHCGPWLCLQTPHHMTAYLSESLDALTVNVSNGRSHFLTNVVVVVLEGSLVLVLMSDGRTSWPCRTVLQLCHRTFSVPDTDVHRTRYPPV